MRGCRYSELGRQLGLSAPAVAERVRKLEEVELITGYHAEVNPAHLGYGVLAFIRLTTSTDKYPARAGAGAAPARNSRMPSRHRRRGVHPESAGDIDPASGIHHRAVECLRPTSTSIVLSSPVRKHSLEPADVQTT